MKEPTPTVQPRLRLNIGGTEPLEGWKILNIQPGPYVDFVGNCTDLSQFDNESVAEVYASHVFEHLNFEQFQKALREVLRILVTGGAFHIGIPDLEALCRLYIRDNLSVEEQVELTRMMFGGQQDPHDQHGIGLNWTLLAGQLGRAGFRSARRRDKFGLFHDDCTTYDYLGVQISLNVTAIK